MRTAFRKFSLSRPDFHWHGSCLLVVVLFISGCRDQTAMHDKMPEENRFRRVVLAEHLYNPMELEIANDGIIYIIQTNGQLIKADPKTRLTKIIATIKNSDNSEFGLIGMALDPNFTLDHWIYLQYFLPDTPNKIAQVSRFTLLDDSLDQSSEKKYVQIPYDNTCCHTAGAMSFDSEGNLYFSTGDNTTAFETTYSPQDERPGHELANDLRSAANSTDLRGKICRIHPEADGTYTIPKGNLFADKTAGRPEIYIMGCRNAYRLFVDKPTNTLFWGEIGPDAGVDSTRGPRGYDEFNIASKAGNYGWPLFIGNNFAYPHIDFANGQILDTPDPASPVNKSRLNTGLQILPPAHPATIYYPYGKSDKFPSLGEGGRAAIGGPVYHYDAGMKSAIKFPEYFDKGWFIGDWMRNWLKVVHLDNDHQVEKIDDLMPSEKFNKPIDMAFSPRDGALYLLEFGVAWGPNPEARLVRIEYNAGNRSPIARLEAGATSGKQPLTVSFSGRQSFDYDHDSLTYSWTIDGKMRAENRADEQFTFEIPGIHQVLLTVADPSGLKNSQEKEVQVGNTAPEISVVLKNSTFYWDTLQYQVLVKDNEDGILGKGISPDSVSVSLSYEPATGGLKSKDGQLFNHGEVLLNENDCKACHAIKGKSVGPDFFSVARRYNKMADTDGKMIGLLANKIITGGTGVWGKSQMSAHPQLNADQTAEIIKYILSLAAEKTPEKKIPVSGKQRLGNKAVPGKEGFYVLQATYTDKGGAAIGPLSATARQVLRFSKLYPGDFDQLSDMKVENHALPAINGSYAVVKSIDLSGITGLGLRTTGSGGCFEIHSDSLNGRRIAVFAVDPNAKKPLELSSAVTKMDGKHDLYLLYINKALRFQQAPVEWLYFKQ